MISPAATHRAALMYTAVIKPSPEKGFGQLLYQSVYMRVKPMQMKESPTSILANFADGWKLDV